MNGKIVIGAALAGVFALAALVTAYSSEREQDAPPEQPKQVSDSFSQPEEEDIRRIVYDYLMTNPEIIIEAVNEYTARERERASARMLESAAENLPALLDPEYGYIAGKDPGKAKVAVIELFDYHCSFCKRATPMIKQTLENDPEVKIVFRELPILREESDLAAEMSLAAREQGKFVELHFAMMSAPGVLTRERIKAFADDLGLDVDQLEKTSRESETRKAIVETHKIAAEMGIDGTPAFIVATLDGSYIEAVEGFRPEELTEKIKAAKRAAK